MVLVKWIYRVKCKTEERNAYGSVWDKFLVAAALTVLLERVLEATWEICTLLLVYFSLIYLFSFLNGLYSDYLKYILNLVDFSRLTPLNLSNIVFEFLLASKCFCESNLFSRKDCQFCNFQVNVVLPQATIRIFYFFFRDDLFCKAVFTWQ